MLSARAPRYGLGLAPAEQTSPPPPLSHTVIPAKAGISPPFATSVDSARRRRRARAEGEGGKGDILQALDNPRAH